MAVEQTAKVKLKFQADTAQARREVDKLQKKQKQAATAAVQGSKDQQRAVEGQIASLGKLAVGIGAAVVAFKQLTDSAKNFAKEAQLKQAAAGLDIKRIQKAARGLITEYEALSFAAATANTDFKLSQQEMEEVGKFMIVLRNQGNDLKSVYEGVTKALVEGNVRGLRQFGIILHGASGKAEAHAKIMARIREENWKAGENIELAGDKALQAANRFEDATHTMSMAVGALADELSVVLDLISKIAEGWALIFSLGGTADLGDAGSLADLQKLRVEEARLAKRVAAGPAAARRRGTQTAMAVGMMPIPGGVGARVAQSAGGAADAEFQRSQQRLKAVRAEIEQLIQLIAKSGPAGRIALGLISPTPLGPALPPERGGKKGAGGLLDDDGPISYRLGVGSVMGPPRGRIAEEVRIPGLETYQAPNIPGPGIEQQGFFAGLEGKDIALKARSDAIKEALEQIITPAQMLENVGSQALQSFAGAAGEAFGAMIDGSKGAGEAFKEFMGQSLLGMSKKLAGDAVYEGVQALIALAKSYWDPTGKSFKEAKAHGAAAAAATFGAVTLGGLAAGLGVGGANTPNPTPPGGAGAVAGAGGDTERNTTIFVGSDFEDNPRANAARLGRVLRRQRQNQGDDDIVVFN